MRHGYSAVTGRALPDSQVYERRWGRSLEPALCELAETVQLRDTGKTDGQAYSGLGAGPLAG